MSLEIGLHESDIRSTKTLGCVEFSSMVLPWLRSPDSTNVSIWEFASGRTILVASSISPLLTVVADEIASVRSQLDRRFAGVVHMLAHNQANGLARLQAPRSHYPIYYDNSGNYRIYAMHIGAGEAEKLFPQLSEKRALVVRIAQCAKTSEKKVYAQISRDQKSHS